MSFRRHFRAVPAVLIAFAALTQSGCLTNCLWQSRLVTAGEHHEGRTKFSGDLRDAKFDATGNLAIPGSLFYADGTIRTGALVFTPERTESLAIGLQGVLAAEPMHVDLRPPEPDYGRFGKPGVDSYQEKISYARFDDHLTKASLGERGYAIRCRLMRRYPVSDYGISTERDPELCDTTFDITYDSLRQDASYDGWDSASKVLLTPVTAAVDVATVPVFAACVVVYPVGVILAVATGNYGPSHLMLEESSQATEAKYRPFFCLIPDGPEIEHWTGLRDYEEAAKQPHAPPSPLPSSEN